MRADSAPRIKINQWTIARGFGLFIEVFGLNYFQIFHVSFEKLCCLKSSATVLKIVIEIMKDLINYVNLYKMKSID